MAKVYPKSWFWMHAFNWLEQTLKIYMQYSMYLPVTMICAVLCWQTYLGIYSSAFCHIWALKKAGIWEDYVSVSIYARGITPSNSMFSFALFHTCRSLWEVREQEHVCLTWQIAIVVHVPTLRTADDFPAWKQAVRLACMSLDVWDCVTGDEAEPENRELQCIFRRSDMCTGRLSLYYSCPLPQTLFRLSKPRPQEKH